MSYDLVLFRAKPGSDLLAAAAASMESEEEDVNPGPFDPDAEARKKQLESALRVVNPSLQPFVFDYTELAKLESVSEAEARRRWRHVEMNGPATGNGIQIMLFDESASVTVPYWHKDELAREVWKEIWSYLEVLERVGTFHTYDPQLDRILDLKNDLDGVVGAYTGGVVATIGTATEHIPAAKPWWKLW